MPQNGLYIGKIYHGRHQPFEHKFTYKVFGLLADIDELPALSERLKYFSFNRWNMLSIHNKDHARRDGSAIRPWIEEAAREKNIDLAGGKIYMLAFPRLWGFVFNPIALFYCYDRAGNLAAVLHQVKNTFGDQHGYLLPVTEMKGKMIAQECDKEMYVSPFIQMDCRYKFRFREPDEKLDFAIHQYQPDGKILTATWTGDFTPLTDNAIKKAVLTHPLMTLKVITAIHWEALRIWLKGAKFLRRPAPPEQDVS